MAGKKGTSKPAGSKSDGPPTSQALTSAQDDNITEKQMAKELNREGKFLIFTLTVHCVMCPYIFIKLRHMRSAHSAIQFPNSSYDRCVLSDFNKVASCYIMVNIRLCVHIFLQDSVICARRTYCNTLPK